LICLNETRSDEEVAGLSAIGQETSESFKYPFQYARGAIDQLQLWKFIRA
jgi:hypothetical protein